MKATFPRGMVCLGVVAIALAAISAEAATTVAYWKFDENVPDNQVSFDVGAIHDETNAHNGTAYGGDPFHDPPDEYVYSRYVNGATGSADSAVRMTLQDWDPAGSYVGDEDDAIYMADSSAFNIDLYSGTTYTFEAIIRAPDPKEIMDPTLYEQAFPQWYDYTDNTILSKPGVGQPDWWAFRLTNQGKLSFVLQDTEGIVSETYSHKAVTGGLWHHVAAKVITDPEVAGKIQYYIDGLLDREVPLPPETAPTEVKLENVIDNPSSLLIGSGRDETAERWSDQFVGDIDAIRISTGAVPFLPTPTNTVPAINVVHSGSTDPNTEAKLRLCDKFYGEATGSSSWTLTEGSGGDPDSGRLQEAANSAAYYRSLLAPEQFKFPEGWTLTATMKLVASNKPWNECIAVADGENTWVMSFMGGPGSTQTGVFKSGDYHFGPSGADSYFESVTEMGNVDPTSGFHQYKMHYDPAGDDGIGVVYFYVDNVQVGMQTRDEAAGVGDTSYSSGNRFWFGDSYPVFYLQQYYVGDIASDAFWSDVTMETGGGVKPVQYMPYDVNEDGFVGADDLDVVRAHWGEEEVTGGKAMGDINLDGFVGADDLDQLRAHWGEEYLPQPGLVPEPSTLLLLAMGGLILCLCRRMAA